MSDYNFLDEHGNCKMRVPGTCVIYTGPQYPCNIKAGLNFNQVVQDLIKCIGQITTTTTTTSSTSTTTTTTAPTTTTTSTSTSTTSTTTQSTSSTTTTTTSHGSTTTTTTTTGPTTTTTSTTTTSTTSTSTTTTTTTSTTTTTTSSTTTSTTTLPSALIFWGAQSSATPPNAAQVQAQSSSTQNPTGTVNVTWVLYNATPQYCWAAVPTAYIKTIWYDNSINNGSIGGPSNLFDYAGTVTISGVSYTIYFTNYQTQFVEATELRP